MLEDSKKVFKDYTRPQYEFELPERIRGDNPNHPKSVTIVELNAKELARVRSRCKSNPDKLTDEAVKESIVELNGTPVSPNRSEVDVMWDNSLQKVLYFLTGAYQKINSPSDDDFGDSLDNFTVKV